MLAEGAIGAWRAVTGVIEDTVVVGGKSHRVVLSSSYNGVNDSCIVLERLDVAMLVVVEPSREDRSPASRRTNSSLIAFEIQFNPGSVLHRSRYWPSSVGYFGQC